MDNREIGRLLSIMFQAHPWHGITPGDRCPEKVQAFIEIVPTDTVKYEVHKPSGHLHIDRPQSFSSMCPTLYGFIPQTFCGPRVADVCERRVNRQNIVGDGDPLDICVISERPINQGNILLNARPIGGMRMIDHNEADDKIIAVLDDDLAYGKFTNITDCPKPIIDRLKHYFLSYKQLPDEPEHLVTIPEVYDIHGAHEVIEASINDYVEKYGAPNERMGQLQELLRR